MSRILLGKILSGVLGAAALLSVAAMPSRAANEQAIVALPAPVVLFLAVYVAEDYFWPKEGLDIKIIYLPGVALRLFRWAASIRDWVVLANWPPQYEVALRFFVDERQIVYLGFVLVSRIVIGLAVMLVARKIWRKPEPTFPN